MKAKKLRRGISPVLATVIIIAVTLVIAVGVIGWIMGIWGSQGSTEALKIYPDTFIDTANKTLVLHVRNDGTASAVIYKIDIVGVESISTTITVPAGADTTQNVALAGTYTPGASYTIKIYTQAGNVYTGNVRAQ